VEEQSCFVSERENLFLSAVLGVVGVVGVGASIGVSASRPLD
jgi:hypothetical protein